MSEGTCATVDWRTVAAAATDGVGVVDGERFVRATRALAERYGYDDPGDLVGTPWRSLFEADERARIEREALPRARAHGDWQGAVVCRRPDGKQFDHTLSLRRTDGGAVVWVVRDAPDRAGSDCDAPNSEGRERDLDRYETIVETATDGIYVLDEDLRFVLVNDGFCELLGRSREELLGTRVTDVIQYDDDAALAEAVRERVVAGDTSTGTVHARGVRPDGERFHVEARYRLYPEPNGAYRGSVGVVRDVTERVERERLLERQRDELDALNRINELVLETTRELVETSSRSAVEETVCERLASSPLYEFAWIGDRALDGDRVVPRASAGDDDGFLDAVDAATDEDAARHGPAETALRTGEVEVATVETDPDAREPDGDAAPWRAAAAARGFRSVAAVPLRDRETVYGVLSVYAERPDAFGERERAGFAILGETVGFVLGSIRSRRLLSADAIVELEFRVADGETLVGRLAAAADWSLALSGYVAADDRWLLYLDVADHPVDELVSTVSADAGVDRARVVAERADHARLEVLADSPLLDTALASGASVRTAETTDEDLRVLVETPVDSDVREVAERIGAVLPDAELRAHRERDRTPEAAHVPAGLLADLTDRQRQAVEAAYRAGYFEWPRESTAEEVADALDVSAPTLHAHLRKAEKGLLSALLD